MVLHHVTSGSVLILFYRKIEVLILFKEQYEIVPPWIVAHIPLGFLDMSWSIMSFQGRPFQVTRGLDWTSSFGELSLCVTSKFAGSRIKFLMSQWSPKLFSFLLQLIVSGAAVAPSSLWCLCDTAEFRTKETPQFPFGKGCWAIRLWLLWNLDSSVWALSSACPQWPKWNPKRNSSSCMEFFQLSAWDYSGANQGESLQIWVCPE